MRRGNEHLLTKLHSVDHADPPLHPRRSAHLRRHPDGPARRRQSLGSALPQSRDSHLRYGGSWLPSISTYPLTYLSLSTPWRLRLVLEIRVHSNAWRTGHYDSHCDRRYQIRRVFCQDGAGHHWRIRGGRASCVRPPTRGRRDAPEEACRALPWPGGISLLQVR